jgi:hypothetical protein
MEAAALPSRRSRVPLCCVQSAVYSPLTIDTADDTRLKFRFSLEAAQQLSVEVNELIAAFKAIAASAKEGKREIQKSLQYRHADDKLVVEIECNPNVFPDAFAAKAYIMVDDGVIRVSSQAMLTQLIENVRTYKNAMAA